MRSTSATERFLRSLFEGVPGAVEVRIITPGGRPLDRRLCSFSDLIDAPLPTGCHVFFGVATRDGRVGGKDAVKAVPALWVDLDCDKSAHGKRDLFLKLMTYPLPPSIVVDSGYGLHAYWLLVEPTVIRASTGIKDVEARLRGLRDALGGDHVHDVSRVMRLPGSSNVKEPSVPRPVRIIHMAEWRRYRPEEFPRGSLVEGGSLADIVAFSRPPQPIKIESLRVSPKIKRLIREGPQARDNYPSRSEADQAAITALLGGGHSPNEVRDVFADQRYRIGEKYREPGAGDRYLSHSIRNAETYRSKEQAEAADNAGTGHERQGSKAAPNQATLLVRLVEESETVLFHDQFNEAFAWAPFPRGHEVLKVRSRSFRLWLALQLWATHNKAPSSEALQSAFNILEARARFEGPKHSLFNRVAWHENAIWYDLGRAAAKITSAGWEVVEDPPILFRRYSHQEEQVRPVPGGDLTTVLDYVNLPESEASTGLTPTRLLFLVTLVVMLVPDIPHPILCVHGEQGSGKTTLFKVLRTLVDPSVTPIMAPPESLRELGQLASHHWAVFFDNLSYMSEWFRDALCRFVTGEGLTKRELYSDDEDVLYSFQRCAGLNGINLVVSSPDLLDRALLFSLDRLPDRRRRTEEEIWSQLHSEKASLLGAIFTVLSKAVAEVGNVQGVRYPRMADFARWGIAVARALGFSDRAFLQALGENTRTQMIEALEASPIAQALLKFMEGRSEWEGSPGQLLTELNAVAFNAGIDTKNKLWPKDGRWVWRRIREVRPNLLDAGYPVEHDRPEGKARICITRVASENDAGVGGNAELHAESEDRQADSQATDAVNMQDVADVKASPGTAGGNTGNIDNIFPSLSGSSSPDQPGEIPGQAEPTGDSERGDMQ